MAKTKRKPEVDWTPSAATEHMRVQMAATLVNGDGRDRNSAVAAATDIGIRLPHFSARYLFQRTTLPFERTIIVFGPPGSNKSALVYWFYDLYIDAGGCYLHIDAEDKDTPILRLSLTKYRDKAGDVIQCKSIDEYQAQIQHYLNCYKQVCAKDGGPGKRTPFIFGIDSLVAKLTAEADRRIEGNHGITERRFSDEARSLSDWFKYIPSRLQGYPLCLAAVNHDKPKAGEMYGQVIHHTPGGSSPNFYSTYKILTAKVKQLKQTNDGWEGNRIRMMMDKNSLGADKRTVDVEIVWRLKAGQSRSGTAVTTVQETTWNWHKATAELLYSMCNPETRKHHGRRGVVAADVLGVGRVSGGRYYSKALGVSVSEALPAFNFGQLVEERREVMDTVEPEFGIHRSVEYLPGIDYDQQRANAAGRVDEFMPAAETVVPPEMEAEDE